MVNLWPRARLPVTAALAFALLQGVRAGPERDRRSKMLEPAVSEVQLISLNPLDVALTCAVEQQESGIRIHYFLSNQSDKTIFTFPLSQVNPAGTVVHPVDVVCDAGAGAVNIVLGLSPARLFAPDQYRIDCRRDQVLVALGPSKNVAATIDLALPLLEWDRHNSGTDWSRVATADQTVLVHTVRLVVDFVRPDRPGFDPEHPDRSAESVWCAASLETPVTLLRHPGFGELDDPARLSAFNLGPDAVNDRESASAGRRELDKAEAEHRAHITRPRRRGTSPADMPTRRR